MHIALDTDAYTKFIYYNDPEVIGLVQRATSIALPVIVLAELKAGFAGGAKLLENTRTLQAFCADKRYVTLEVNEATTDYYARFKQELRLAGTPIPANDLWIAALVAQYDYQLVTSDAHFDQLPSLPRVKN